MKTIKMLSLVVVTFLAASCNSVRVAADYDDTVNFSQYKTYAFLKDGVDEAKISDIDKKRILKAIDVQMQQRGFTKSEKPDILINFFTKSSKDVNVNNWGGYYGGWGGYGWGWGGYYGGWGYPWGWGGNYTSVSTQTSGTLFIDFIDASKKELVWQGVGEGVLVSNRDKKMERINEFVQKIIAEYPPQKEK